MIKSRISGARLGDVEERSRRGTGMIRVSAPAKALNIVKEQVLKCLRLLLALSLTI
jgi:hypothetical protein